MGSALSRLEFCLAVLLYCGLALMGTQDAYAQAQATETPAPKGHAFETKMEVRSFPPLRMTNAGAVVPERYPEREEHEPAMSALGKLQKQRANAGYIPERSLPGASFSDRIPPKTNGKVESSPATIATDSFMGMKSVIDPKGFIHQPPDVTIAVGPYQVVAMDNVEVSVFDKTGDLRFNTYLGDLFYIPNPQDTILITDPVVVYDEYQQVFWATLDVIDETTQTSYVSVWVSEGNDLEFYGYHTGALITSTGIPDWCDYPKLGLDTEAIYITCNLFNFPTQSGSFIESAITVMSKTEWIYPNGTIKGWTFEPVPQINDYPYIQAFSIQPAVMHGATDANGEFLAYGFQGGGAIGTIQITNPLNCCGQYPQAPGFRYSGWIDVPISAPPDAPQLGSSNSIDTGDGRLLFANWNSGNLSMGLNSNCNGYSCAGFVELTNLTTTSTIVNAWGLQETGNDYFYPSVDSRPDGWKSMAFGTSNSGMYPSSDLTGIPPSGDCTACTTALETQENGLSPYDLNESCVGVTGAPNVCRWGDYFGVARDPDGTGIWVSGEYAASTAQFNWDTWISATYQNYYAAANFSPGSLAFGNQQISTTSGQLGVTVSSVGNATLLPSVYSASPPFSIVANSSTCSPYDIEPGQTCTFDVVFAPQTAGIASGTLYLYDNAVPSPQEVSLSGVGISPSLSFTPLEINFGTKLIDNHSVPADIHLTNTGTTSIGPLIVSASRNFRQSNTCANGIVSGGGCTITAVFNPLVTGPINGTVSVSGAFTGSPAAILVSGLGTAVSFLPVKLHFAAQKVGTTSPVKTFTMKNHATTALRIASITSTGDFAIRSNNCGIELAGPGSCAIGVTFTPTAKGARTGGILIFDSDPTNQQVVPLSGAGK